MSPTSTLDPALESLAEGAWTDALTMAEALAGTLEGEDEGDRLDVVAEASWWVGRMDDCIDARERAYRSFEEAGADRKAGQCAVWLWEHYALKARPAIGGAWLRRARTALEGHEATVEYGSLLLREAEVAHGSGDLDRGFDIAGDALTLARAIRSPDIEAEAHQAIGRLLIDRGEPAEGLAHLDEAMLSAVEGRLRPYTTGKVYCSMISACEQLGDLARAREWTDATSRWSQSHPLAMWPGICRVHHAALLQLRGDWEAAEREARRACDELDGFHVANAAAAHIEIGEIRRRLGDLDGAEEAFATAEEMCGHVTAGLALLRLAQGRVDDAAEVIGRLLSDESWNRPARGKLLPAQAQILVASGDLEAAAKAVEELETIAADYDSAALGAAALSSRGRLQLATGDAGGACATLHRALARWSELEVPYEVATVQLLLGQACRNRSDEDGARRALGAAAGIFDRLGASLDAARVPTDGVEVRLPKGLTAREAEVLRLVAAGRTNREISTELHLSERTVARHLSNIFTKIDVTSRTAAAAFAFENRLVTPPGA